MAAGSSLCKIAEFYQKLAAFFRQIGQVRLADQLERVYKFLSQIGQCEIAIPPALSKKMQALGQRSETPLDLSDVMDWLHLADALDQLIP